MKLSKKQWTSLFAVVLSGFAIVTFVFLGVQRKASKAPPFLPGIYTSQEDNELCRIDDTLVIRRIHPGGDDYTVTRSISLFRKISDTARKAESIHQQWQAQYEPKGNMLMTAIPQHTIRYYPEENSIATADFYYQKIE
jgi:hypothetical protein